MLYILFLLAGLLINFNIFCCDKPGLISEEPPLPTLATLFASPTTICSGADTSLILYLTIRDSASPPFIVDWTDGIMRASAAAPASTAATAIDLALPRELEKGMSDKEIAFFKKFKRGLGNNTQFLFARNYVQYALSAAVNNGYKRVVKIIMKLISPVRLDLVKILINTLEDYYNPERSEPEYEEEQEKIASALETVVRYTRGHINDSWQGKSPLQVALKLQNSELVQLLLSYGAKPNGSRRTCRPLYEAAKKGNKELITMLILHGADPNTLDYFGDTILSKLRKSGKYPEMVDLLVKVGAQERVVNYKRLSKIMGFDVLSLPNRSFKEQAEILLKLTDSHLAVLCLISGEYCKLVKDVLTKINSFDVFNLSLEGFEILTMLREQREMPLSWELDACRCGLDISQYAAMREEIEKYMSPLRLAFLVKRLLVFTDHILAEGERRASV